MDRRYVIRRLLQVLPAVAAILVITFAIVHAAPGDPVVAVAGENGNQEYYDFMRAKFGLDQPLPRQFLTYSENVLTGDLGASFAQGERVSSLIVERVPATLLLWSRRCWRPHSAASPLAPSPLAVRSGRSTSP